jgi:hypothetical protein
MWQVDNDRYALWRLEQELAPRKIDRLLDSVTVSDREQPVAVLPVARGLAAALGLLARSLYRPLPATPIVRRASE